VSVSKPQPSARHPRANGSAGFTLLEALIAIVILALSLGALLQLYGTGLRGIATIDDNLRARLLAQSVMAEVSYDRSLQPGRLQGRLDQFAWTLSITLFDESPTDIVSCAPPISSSDSPPAGSKAGSRLRQSRAWSGLVSHSFTRSGARSGMTCKAGPPSGEPPKPPSPRAKMDETMVNNLSPLPASRVTRSCTRTAPLPSPLPHPVSPKTIRRNRYG